MSRTLVKDETTSELFARILRRRNWQCMWSTTSYQLVVNRSSAKKGEGANRSPSL